MAPHPDRRVQAASEIVAGYMDRILALFKPGARVTVIVRQPDTPDGSRDFLQTNDRLDDVIAAVRRRQDAATTLRGEAKGRGV